MKNHDAGEYSVFVESFYSINGENFTSFDYERRFAKFFSVCPAELACHQ